MAVIGRSSTMSYTILARSVIYRFYAIQAMDNKDIDQAVRIYMLTGAFIVCIGKSRLFYEAHCEKNYQVPHKLGFTVKEKC